MGWCASRDRQARTHLYDESRPPAPTWAADLGAAILDHRADPPWPGVPHLDLHRGHLRVRPWGRWL